MGLGEILATAERLPDGIRVAIPESWHQGRTAYGGLTAALTLAAARQAGGEDLPPLRSAQVSFVGPVSGEVEARARVLRRGRNAVWITAELVCGGGVGTAATFVFMKPVENKLHLKHPAALPGLIPVEEAPERKPPPGAPQLLDHLDIRFALPRNVERRPEICWWVRARERKGLDPVMHLLLCGDAPPPGVFPLLARPVPPLSSMTWLANFLSPSPQARDGWLLLRTVGDYAESGCSSDRTEIWNADGEPLMLGMQSVAIFG